jgi:2-methylcitrate dehydratase PrpD
VSVTADLARWAVAATPPAPTLATARLHLLDGLGCAVAALRRGDVGPASAVAAGLGGPPEATLFARAEGFGRIGAASAALGNAVAMHALDFDDTHAGGLVHATVAVAPTALAVGEQLGAGGAETLAAFAVGLEVVCRLGAAAPHAFHARGLHATSVCGVVASALTAARLMGLDATGAANALGIAASGSAGLLEFLHGGATTKQLHPGFAAHAGIVAARLAAAGATGPRGALEGRYGLYRALADREPATAVLTGDLGSRWEADRITVKPYAACQLSHAAIDAARSARAARADIDWASRAAGTGVRVVVDLHPDAVPIVWGPRQAPPTSAYEAKFSLAWCVAAMLCDGSLGLDAFDRFADERYLGLAAAVEVRVVDGPGPAADQPGRLMVERAGAAPMCFEVPRSRGGPDDPELEETVRVKAVENLGPGAEGVLAAIAGLSAATDLTAVVRAVRGAIRSGVR